MNEIGIDAINDYVGKWSQDQLAGIRRPPCSATAGKRLERSRRGIETPNCRPSQRRMLLTQIIVDRTQVFSGSG